MCVSKQQLENMYVVTKKFIIYQEVTITQQLDRQVAVSIDAPLVNILLALVVQHLVLCVQLENTSNIQLDGFVTQHLKVDTFRR